MAKTENEELEIKRYCLKQILDGIDKLKDFNNYITAPMKSDINLMLDNNTSDKRNKASKETEDADWYESIKYDLEE